MEFLLMLWCAHEKHRYFRKSWCHARGISHLEKPNEFKRKKLKKIGEYAPLSKFGLIVYMIVTYKTTKVTKVTQETLRPQVKVNTKIHHINVLLKVIPLSVVHLNKGQGKFVKPSVPKSDSIVNFVNLNVEMSKFKNDESDNLNKKVETSNVCGNPPNENFVEKLLNYVIH